jgi:hypothetical protein
MINFLRSLLSPRTVEDEKRKIAEDEEYEFAQRKKRRDEAKYVRFFLF